MGWRGAAGFAASGSIETIRIVDIQRDIGATLGDNRLRELGVDMAATSRGFSRHHRGLRGLSVCLAVVAFALTACGDVPVISPPTAAPAPARATTARARAAAAATAVTTTVPSVALPPPTTTPTAPPTTAPKPPTTVAAASAPRPAAVASNRPSPCAVAIAYIAAHGAPGWTTVCGRDAGYDVPGCVAGAHAFGGRLPYGCTDGSTHTTYIACPVFVVYANEAENQRYLSGLGGRVDAYGEAPQCAYANPLGN